jgi:hypothetical protein
MARGVILPIENERIESGHAVMPLSPGITWYLSYSIVSALPGKHELSARKARIECLHAEGDEGLTYDAETGLQRYGDAWASRLQRGRIWLQCAGVQRKDRILQKFSPSLDLQLDLTLLSQKSLNQNSLYTWRVPCQGPSRKMSPIAVASMLTASHPGYIALLLGFETH